MSKLINPYSSQSTSGDNYKDALSYLDRILLIAPNYDNFNVSDLIKKLEPDFKKAEPIRNFKEKLINL